MSPPATAVRGQRAGDILGSSVPLMMAVAAVISAVTSTIAASAFFWVTQMDNRVRQTELGGEIRLIREQLDSASKIAAAESRTSEIQQQTQTKALDDLRGAVRLLQLQYDQVSKSIAERR